MVEPASHQAKNETISCIARLLSSEDVTGEMFARAIEECSDEGQLKVFQALVSSLNKTPAQLSSETCAALLPLAEQMVRAILYFGINANVCTDGLQELLTEVATARRNLADAVSERQNLTGERDRLRHSLGLNLADAATLKEELDILRQIEVLLAVRKDLVQEFEDRSAYLVALREAAVRAPSQIQALVEQSDLIKNLLDEQEKILIDEWKSANEDWLRWQKRVFDNRTTP